MKNSKAEGAGPTGEAWRNLYETPQDLVDEIEYTLGMVIVLDVASSEANHKGRGGWIDADENSLVVGGVEWARRAQRFAIALGVVDALILENPPYGDKLPWVREAMRAARAGATIAFVVPLDTSSKWAKLAIWGGCCVAVYHPGRIAFDLPPEAPKGAKSASPNGGTMVVVFGPNGVKYPRHLPMYKSEADRLAVEGQGVLI